MRKYRSKRILAILLAALIVSSSSSIVFATNANTSESNTSASQTEEDIYAFPDVMPTASIPDKLPDGSYSVPIYMYVSNQDEAFLMEIDYDSMIKTGGVEVDKSELADEIDFAEYMFAQELDWSTLLKTDEDIIPEEHEKQSPAVDIASEPSGVKAHADAGVFPEGVQMAVTPITSGDMFDKAKTALDGTSGKFTVYEIHFVDAEGNAVQPNGVVTVSYPIPSDYDSTALALYRINEDGTKTLVKGEAADGFYTVMQRSFSTYVLADISKSGNTPGSKGDNSGNSAPENKSSTNTAPSNNGSGANTVVQTGSSTASDTASSAPKTGDSTGSVLAAVLMMLCAAGAAVFAGKRKKETGEK